MTDFDYDLSHEEAGDLHAMFVAGHCDALPEDEGRTVYARREYVLAHDYPMPLPGMKQADRIRFEIAEVGFVENGHASLRHEMVFMRGKRRLFGLIASEDCQLWTVDVRNNLDLNPDPGLFERVRGDFYEQEQLMNVYHDPAATRR